VASVGAALDPVSVSCTVPLVAQERILYAAEVLDVRDLVTVWAWPPVAARPG
jgi:hypothetical protein